MYQVIREGHTYTNASGIRVRAALLPDIDTTRTNGPSLLAVEAAIDNRQISLLYSVKNGMRVSHRANAEAATGRLLHSDGAGMLPPGQCRWDV